MNYKQNLHTHSSFCDGKQTPREVVETAITLGFDSVGFSGHSPMFFSPKNGMDPDRVNEYFETINSLKEEYSSKIKVFCGWEYDMYSDISLPQGDYSIGSVHYFNLNGEYVGFDRSQDEVKRVIDTYFGGNGLLYAQKYYEEIERLPQYGKFDIIGHFDLITKHCENADFFDIHSEEYLQYAKNAIRALAGKIPYFEVNTGAIARGYRTTPYPMENLVTEFKNQGFGAVISSDCHDAQKLDCNFEQAVKLLKNCGYNEHIILTEDGFKAVPL